MPEPMTSRERLLALLAGRPTDRIGLHVMGVRPWTDWWMAGRHPSYRPVIDAVAAKTDLCALIGFDTGFLYSASSVEVRNRVDAAPDHPHVEHRIQEVNTPAGVLREVHAVDTREPLPMPIEHFIKTPADLEGLLALPFEPIRPDLEPILELDGRIGDRGVVWIGIGSGPIGDVHRLLGSERMAVWAYEHRELIHRLLAEMLRRKLAALESVAFSRLAAKMPIVFTYTGPESAVPPLHGPDDFRDFVARYDSLLHDAMHAMGGYVRVHCHGSVGQVLADFAAMGADQLHPVEAPPMGDVTLAEAKRLTGGRVTLEGNIQIANIIEDDTNAFAELVAATIEEGKPGGRFCLCPTASPYQVELSERTVRNYLTLIDMALDLGRY